MRPLIQIRIDALLLMEEYGLEEKEKMTHVRYG
jgi:hypothetical protein